MHSVTGHATVHEQIDERAGHRDDGVDAAKGAALQAFVEPVLPPAAGEPMDGGHAADSQPPRHAGVDHVHPGTVGVQDIGAEPAAQVGDGRELAAGQRRAAALGLDSQIRWHGAVDQAGRLLAAFDCFVLSSRTEGTPIVLFEAMAAAVPVVATTVGGVPDVVSRHEASLVAPGDPIALAGAIAEVKGAPAVAAARAQAARTRLDRDFAAGSWIERYTTVYRTVLKGKQRP